MSDIYNDMYELKKEKDSISREQFKKYELVRKSGITNMNNTSLISKFSGLHKHTISKIRDNYSYFKNKYSD